jgi:hypothetical protein
MTDTRGVERREFLKAAVAIGGTAALSACLDRERADVPTGPDDPTTLPERQHAWNAAMPTDDHGNAVAPRHRLLLSLTLDRDGPPTERDRERVATALRGVERAYARAADGLLLTVSYSPVYFERFDAGVPDSVDLPAPEALAPFEDPQLDTPDVVVHLASNHAQVVLGAEEALTGGRETVNGVSEPDAAGTDALSIYDRRT